MYKYLWFINFLCLLAFCTKNSSCNIPGNKMMNLIFCWPCISIYLFLNINRLDALNFTISLFQASTCFEHMYSSSGGQKLYYTVSGITTPIGGLPVHGKATYKCDDTRYCIIQFLPSWRWAHVLETCPSHSSRFYHSHNIGWGVQII